MPEDTADAGRPDWRDDLDRLSRHPNVVARLSGFGTFLHACDGDRIRRQTEDTVALFGAARCLWGSNSPIEKLWTSYATLLEAHRQAAGGSGGCRSTAS